MRILLITIGLLMAACSPAAIRPPTPPVTPGDFVINGDWYESHGVRLRIPDGWRTVTGESDRPLSLTLVAPDQCGLLTLSSEPVSAVPQSNACEQSIDFVTTQVVATEQGDIYVALSGPQAQVEMLQLVLSTFITTIESAR